MPADIPPPWSALPRSKEFDMKRFFTNMVARLSKQHRAPVATKRGRAARLGVESLEERQLLSTTPLALHLASAPAAAALRESRATLQVLTNSPAQAALSGGAKTVLDGKSALLHSGIYGHIRPGIFAPSMGGDVLQLFIAQGSGELSGQYLGALTVNTEYAIGSFVGTWGNQHVSGTIAWSGDVKHATVQFTTSAGVAYSLNVAVGPSGNWQAAGLSVFGTVFIPSFGQQSVSGYGYHN
jgi:hypothetical protein